MFGRRRPISRRDVPPREGHWFADPRPLRATQKKLPHFWTYFVMGPILYDLLGKYVGIRAPHWSSYLVIFGFACLLLMALVWRLLEILALRPLTADRALSDSPSDITEYPVEITLFDAHGCLGVDRGIVWFEDGLLTFNGRACSFALAANDFYDRREWNGRDLHAGMPGDALRFRTPRRTTYVRFQPLMGVRRLSFGYQLGRFLASVPTSAAPRQWPPLVSYRMQATKPPPTLDTPEAIEGDAARTGSARGAVRNCP